MTTTAEAIAQTKEAVNWARGFQYAEASVPVRAAEALLASHAALLEALKPFANMAHHYPMDAKHGNRPRSGTVMAVATKSEEGEITVEDLHAARDAIQSATQSTKESTNAADETNR